MTRLKGVPNKVARKYSKVVVARITPEHKAKLIKIREKLNKSETELVRPLIVKMIEDFEADEAIEEYAKSKVQSVEPQV